MSDGSSVGVAMTTERTWVTDANFTVYTGGSYLNCGQNIMLTLKNRLVASGGWAVIGSSDGVANYEYDGVTGGGSYGGDSTGPYDVWADIGDVRRQEDGSGPGWVLMQSATFYGSTLYLVLSMEGTSDSSSNGYMSVCEVAPTLHPDNPLTFLPVEVSTPLRRTRRQFFLMYSGTYTTRGYLSMCPEDGSFVFAMNLTIRTYWTGLISCNRVDPNTSPEGYIGAVIGMAGGNNTFGTATVGNAFKIPSGNIFSEELMEADVYPILPYRYNGVDVMNIDLNTVDCDGEASLFPFYISVEADEQKCGMFGRLVDCWIAPRGLDDGDTVPTGTPEYFTFGYVMFPGDTVPLVGP